MNNDFDPNRLTVLPSGYFGTSSDLIYIVNNLLSKEEIETLLLAARDLEIWKESEFRNKYTDIKKLQEKYPEVYLLLEDITLRWKPLVSKFFNVEIKTYMNPMSKWPVGGSQKPHADKEWEDGSPAQENYYDIGSVIYLNDDYEGGEIYFPDHNIDLRPKPGTAIAFPGDLFFMHGVKELSKTERYTIPIFWTVPEYKVDNDKTIL